MNKYSIFGIWILILISPINALSFSDSLYNISISNLDQGAHNISDIDYNIEYSLINSPILDVNDSDFNIYVGFENPDLKAHEEAPDITPIITGFVGINPGGDSGLNKALIGTYYDIIITVGKDYEQGTVVKADLTLLNKGDKPDRDTILIYYLVDAYGNRIKEKREQLYEVPIGRTNYQIELKLPDKARLGEWKFKIEYLAMGQPLIEVWDSFDVKPMTHIQQVENNFTGNFVERVKEVLVPIVPKHFIVAIWIIGTSLFLITLINLMKFMFRMKRNKRINSVGNLIKAIEECEKAKFKVEEYIKNIEEAYIKGRIVTSSAYKAMLDKKLDWRTPSEWIEYYDDLLTVYRNRLEKIGKK